MLTALKLRSASGEYKVIDGVSPNLVYLTSKGEEVVLTQEEQGNREWIYLEHLYSELKVETTYSGGLATGRGFIRGMGVYEWPFSYEMVLEFLFEDGEIKTIVDRSERIREIRRALRQDDVPNLLSELERNFSLEYDFNYPLNLYFEKCMRRVNRAT